MDASGTQSTEAQALFTFQDTSRYTRLKRSQAYSLMKKGQFPKPIKIGKSSRWVKAHIDAWIAAQVAEQQAVSPPLEQQPVPAAQTAPPAPQPTKAKPAALRKWSAVIAQTA